MNAISSHTGTTANLALYQSSTCWFCAKVRHKMAELGLELELRDIGSNADYRRELMAQGGKAQVPCLRIETADGKVEWMYESADICAYLERHFAAQSGARR